MRPTNQTVNYWLTSNWNIFCIRLICYYFSFESHKLLHLCIVCGCIVAVSGPDSALRKTQVSFLDCYSLSYTYELNEGWRGKKKKKKVARGDGYIFKMLECFDISFEWAGRFLRASLWNTFLKTVAPELTQQEAITDGSNHTQKIPLFGAGDNLCVLYLHF